MAADKERAKRIITEILRHCPQGIGKTKLFKAFWLAHLFYANEQPGFLSDWPVVRMPHGPGIDECGTLFGELTNEGRMKVGCSFNGPFTEISHQLNRQDYERLPEEAERAVKEAVDFILPRSATACSELSHEYSRSWNERANGEEMDIYSDLIPDTDYERLKTESDRIAADVLEVFK